MPKKIPPHINSYCPHCKAEGKEKVRAIWRAHPSFGNMQDRACDEHKSRIRDPKPDDHLSEADHATWMRL